MKNKLKKLLIGVTTAITIGGGSIIFSYTADGCSVKYVQVRDAKNQLTPLDKDGQTIKGLF